MTRLKEIFVTSRLTCTCRFTVAIATCYTEPNLVCSSSIRGTVNVRTNSCPSYTGAGRASVSANLNDGAVVFSLNMRDSDPGHFGELAYQILGDAASLRDFIVDSQGNIRTQASYRDSSVSTYNMQIIVRDGSTTRPCFVPVNLLIVVERNRLAPSFSNSSSTYTVIETHSVTLQLFTLTVSQAE